MHSYPLGSGTLRSATELSVTNDRIPPVHLSYTSRSRRRRLPLTLTAFTTVAASTVLGLAGPAHAAGNVAYPHSVPTWATHARDAGKASASQTVEGEIYLRLKDLDGATALATAVSTPGSPQYRNWVTPQQWINRFSPPPSVYNGLLK